jgi:hypothetical protein
MNNNQRANRIIADMQSEGYDDIEIDAAVEAFWDAKIDQYEDRKLEAYLDTKEYLK